LHKSSNIQTPLMCPHESEVPVTLIAGVWHNEMVQGFDEEVEEGGGGAERR
jgi:hypothetical protein